MYAPKDIEKIVLEALNEPEEYLVHLSVSSSNKIIIRVDALEGMPVKRCVDVSRAVEGSLDREVADFELEVSTPGLTEPFQVEQQFIKNVGRSLEVMYNSGEKIVGELEKVDENEIILIQKEKVKIPGRKKKEEKIIHTKIERTHIKQAKVKLAF